MSLLNSRKDLLTFGIFARDFGNDGSFGTRLQGSVLMITLMAVIYKFL